MTNAGRTVVRHPVLTLMTWGVVLVFGVVFASFMLSPILLVKELGFALAVAIVIDATVVRMVIVPATMRLVDDWNWWLPDPLARLLPELELEREVDGVGLGAT